jgi:putative transposase
LTLSERARLRELERENRDLRMQNEFLKKQRHNFRVEATVSDKYELIDAEKATYPIAKICAWLDVSKSGFYEWRDRPASLSEQRRQELKARSNRSSTTATPRTATDACTWS